MMKKAIQNTEDPSLIRIQFCDNSINNYVHHEWTSVDTPLIELLNHSCREKLDLDYMFILLKVPKMSEEEMVHIFRSNEESWFIENEDEYEIEYSFDTSSLENLSYDPYDVLANIAHGMEFMKRLKKKFKSIENILGVRDLMVTDTPLSYKSEVVFDFDDEYPGESKLHFRISLDLKDINKSMKIADLLTNFSKISAILNKIIQGIPKYRDTY